MDEADFDEPVISMTRARLVTANLDRLCRLEPGLGSGAGLDVVVDTLVVDDEAGRRRGFVVQGDGVTHVDLRRALAAGGGLEERLTHLPRVLAEAVRSAG